MAPLTKRQRQRASQRTILPTAVKARNIGDVIFLSSTGSATITIDSAQFTTFRARLNQVDEFSILGIPYINAYTGSDTNDNRLYPFVGANNNMGNWNIWGFGHDLYQFTSLGAEKFRDSMSIPIYNVSAGSVSLTVSVRWKYITPRQEATGTSA